MNRRFLLSSLAAIAAAPAALAQAVRPMGAPVAATATTNLADVKSVAQFYAGVLPRAELSLTTSQMGVAMATNRNAHEFAGFELGEAITVNMVLKDIGVVAPAMDAVSAGVVDKLKASAKGAAFDRAYIALQLENHQQLLELADAYLHNTVGVADPMEKHGRHLGSLMLGNFKEHVAICKRIHGELGA